MIRMNLMKWAAAAGLALAVIPAMGMARHTHTVTAAGLTTSATPVKHTTTASKGKKLTTHKSTAHKKTTPTRHKSTARHASTRKHTKSKSTKGKTSARHHTVTKSTKKKS